MSILPQILSFFNDERSRVLRYATTGSNNGSITMFIGGQDSASGNFEMSLTGHIQVTNTATLTLWNANTEKLYPSGTSASSGNWLNSDLNTTDMWSYVDEDPYNTLLDSTSIRSYQSGNIVTPQNLYWVAQGGIHKYNLTSSGVTRIFDSSIDTELSTHIAYNEVDESVYYGVENGNDGYVKKIDDLGLRDATVTSDFGAGLAFSYRNNTLYGMNKDGNFKSSYVDGSSYSLTSLLGRETLNRRVRINSTTDEMYALQTESTSYLTKVYKYDRGTNTWDYLRILSYGMFGGAFDIDFASGNIYYTATSDYFTPSYYGIVKESLTSGSGTRIISVNSPTYFQTKELVFDNYNRQLYYVGEDISGANKVFNLVKTDDAGAGGTTLLSLPEVSGIAAMCLDGQTYRSYIDFDLTDLTTNFTLSGSTDANVQRAFVTVKGKNSNDLSYIKAKVLTSDKSNYVWYPSYSSSAFRLASSSTINDIGNNTSSINTSYNTVSAWDNGVLRLSVTASPSGNQDITEIESVNVTLVSNSVTGLQVTNSLTMYTNASITVENSIPMHTLSDSAISSIDLFTYSSVEASGEITGYVYGKETSESSSTLYILGTIPSLESPLYSYGHDSSSGVITLHTSALGVPSAYIPLFLSVHDPVSSSGSFGMFVYGAETPSVFAVLDLFTTTIASAPATVTMPLFIEGVGGISRSSSMNLYLHSVTPSISNTLDLVLGNYSSGTYNSITMMMKGPAGLDGGAYGSGVMSMVIGANNDQPYGSIPLFITTEQQSYNYMPLMLEGQPNYRAEMTMTISGISPVNNSIWLYI